MDAPERAWPAADALWRLDLVDANGVSRGQGSGILLDDRRLATAYHVLAIGATDAQSLRLTRDDVTLDIQLPRLREWIRGEVDAVILHLPTSLPASKTLLVPETAEGWDALGERIDRHHLLGYGGSVLPSRAQLRDSYARRLNTPSRPRASINAALLRLSLATGSTKLKYIVLALTTDTDDESDGILRDMGWLDRRPRPTGSSAQVIYGPDDDLWLVPVAARSVVVKGDSGGAWIGMDSDENPHLLGILSWRSMRRVSVDAPGLLLPRDRIIRTGSTTRNSLRRLKLPNRTRRFDVEIVKTVPIHEVPSENKIDLSSCAYWLRGGAKL